MMAAVPNFKQRKESSLHADGLFVALFRRTGLLDPLAYPFVCVTIIFWYGTSPMVRKSNAGEVQRQLVRLLSLRTLTSFAIHFR